MAKLYPEKLSGQLAKGLAPIYIVSGDEPLLVQEACDTIRLAARKKGFSEREIYHIDPKFDWGQLHHCANSLSLFSEQKIIEIRMPTGKPGDKGGKALLEYAKAPSPDNLLLLIMGKIDASGQRSKWFKGIESAGVHIAVWPVDADKLPRWINQRLQLAGLSADSGAVDLLASRIEGNLLAAVQEIEKLKLLAQDNVVSTELMASVVADSARYNMFGLSDKALNGDIRGTVKTLHGLKSEGTEVVPILWALTRDIRQLLQVAQATEQGKHLDTAMKQAGIWAKRQALAKHALRRLTSSHLEQLLRQANGIDRAIKGMRAASVWDELLDLVLNLAGVTSLHPSNVRLALKL